MAANEDCTRHLSYSPRWLQQPDIPCRLHAAMVRASPARSGHFSEEKAASEGAFGDEDSGAESSFPAGKVLPASGSTACGLISEWRLAASGSEWGYNESYRAGDCSAQQFTPCCMHARKCASASSRTTPSPPSSERPRIELASMQLRAHPPAPHCCCPPPRPPHTGRSRIPDLPVIDEGCGCDHFKAAAVASYRLRRCILSTRVNNGGDRNRDPGFSFFPVEGAERVRLHRIRYSELSGLANTKLIPALANMFLGIRQGEGSEQRV